LIEKTSVEIVEQWAQYRHKGEPKLTGLTEEDLRTHYPSIPKTLSRRNRVTRSVHCECTLVMKIVDDYVQQGTTPTGNLEVGVSKSLCNLCAVFLSLIHTSYPNITIMVSTNHGKNVAGWRLPLSVSAEVGRMLERHVQSSVEEIRSEALRERRSTSAPRVAGSQYDSRSAAATDQKMYDGSLSWSWAGL